VASTIIGATSMAQLQSNIDSFSLYLPDDLLERLEQVHRQYSNPSP